MHTKEVPKDKIQDLAMDLLNFDNPKNTERAIMESIFDVTLRYFETHCKCEAYENQLLALRQVLYFFWSYQDLQENLNTKAYESN